MVMCGFSGRLDYSGGRGFVQAMQVKVTQGHTVDALACNDDEGRAKLRKVAGSCNEAVIRGYPNGATHPGTFSAGVSPSNRGGEPSELKHLSRKRKRQQQ